MISYSTAERIDGLINQNDLESFKQAIENIANDLEEDGFSLSDVKAYLQRELDEILGATPNSMRVDSLGNQ